MDKVLEFKNNFEELTINELNASCKIKNADSKFIVEPQRVFADTIELLNKHNITYDMLPIIVKGGQHALYNEDLANYIGQEKNIKAFTFLRTSGIITMPSLTNSETTMQIRLDITERGITMSTGKLVLVCTNGMTAYQGDIFSTYGKNKIQYENALQIIENWIQTMPEKSQRYEHLINQLKSIEVRNNSVETLIGKLMLQAVKGNMDNFVAPLNVTQVGKFTTSYLEQSEKDIKTAWDLYNMGTDMFKHESMDMTIIAERNYAFSKFLIQDFGLNIEDAVLVSEEF